MTLTTASPLRVTLNQVEQFDEAIHGPDSLPSADGMQIITKDNGTESGRGIACITWAVVMPDGTLKRAQYTTTIRLLKTALKILEGRYDDEGRVNVLTAGN